MQMSMSGAANGGRSLSGKVAFVTGAGSGIGRATAVAFARAGADVAVVNRGQEGADEAARQVKEVGEGALAVRADVSRAEDVRRATEETISGFGRLDFAFNNAGIEEKISATADIEVEEWDRVIGVNLRGVFLAMKYQIPQMLRQGGGAIVNSGSVSGLVGDQGVAAYTASKHGVVGLTKTAALDYAASNIRINAVCPGATETPMLQRLSGGTRESRERMLSLEPIGRLAKPEEIANVVVWLCSDGASYVTGHALAVDGGFTIR
jgi:NAD(P)-dependent dehydrogenase (short-subunit alcohol dehydrogenase family)